MIKNVNLDGLDVEQRDSVVELLEAESDVFSKTKNDIGFIPDFKFDIKVTDDLPFSEDIGKSQAHFSRKLRITSRIC